jgi:ribosome-binding protein aMBF1 (putative translation factor)
MLLAAKIADAMKKKGWRKIDLARETKQQPSVITKWLSGTHNFESDTLFDLEYHLDAKFINTEEKQKEQTLYFYGNITQKITSEKYDDLINTTRQIFSNSVLQGNQQGSC